MRKMEYEKDEGKQGHRTEGVWRRAETAFPDSPIRNLNNGHNLCKCFSVNGLQAKPARSVQNQYRRVTLDNGSDDPTFKLTPP
jgi:hypothetical protein